MTACMRLATLRYYTEVALIGIILWRLHAGTLRTDLRIRPLQDGPQSAARSRMYVIIPIPPAIGTTTSCLGPTVYVKYSYRVGTGY